MLPCFFRRERGQQGRESHGFRKVRKYKDWGHRKQFNMHPFFNVISLILSGHKLKSYREVVQTGRSILH